VKFRSRQTGSADFIRSVAVVRLAVVKLQHAWQGLTPWVAGTWCFPSLVLTAHSKVSPRRRNHANAGTQPPSFHPLIVRHYPEGIPVHRVGHCPPSCTADFEIVWHTVPSLRSATKGIIALFSRPALEGQTPFLCRPARATRVTTPRQDAEEIL
jgi:hypothetical protein